MPFNELNRAFDLGFKPLPWGDKGYIPSAMVLADGHQAEGEAPSVSAGTGPAKNGEPDAFSRLAASLTTKGNHQ